MIDVCVTSTAFHMSHVDDIARGLGRYLRMVPRSGDPHAHSATACLHITPCRLQGPFSVHPGRGVVVSTWDSDGVCRYAGIELGDYLLIASLLALSQWRVLRGNPLLQIEDLQHPRDVRCLFAGPHTVQDFALLLDPPVVCRGCENFYHCLGADSELIALRQVVAKVNALQGRALAASIFPRRN